MFSLFDIKMDLGLLSGTREPEHWSREQRAWTRYRGEKDKIKEVEGGKRTLPTSCLWASEWLRGAPRGVQICVPRMWFAGEGGVRHHFSWGSRFLQVQMSTLVTAHGASHPGHPRTGFTLNHVHCSFLDSRPAWQNEQLWLQDLAQVICISL